MTIIETQQEYTSFMQKYSSTDWIVVPVYCNGDYPVYVDSISLIYVYAINYDKDCVLVLNHTEGLNLQIDLADSLPKDNVCYIHNKKRFSQFVQQDNLIDMDLIEYFYRNRPMPDEFDTTAHEFFERKYHRFKNLNAIIPITKHVERCRNIRDTFFDVYNLLKIDQSFTFYNTVILNSLQAIEKNGMYVNASKFANVFPDYPIHDNFVYTEYNIYTTTGRPSNRFNGVNFGALNKETGIRDAFCSRFAQDGFMISFDYDAYHLRLLAVLVDYKFPDNVSVHEHLGEYYFQKSNLSEEEYQESKSISFRQLYGGIATEYLVIPFFEKVHEYTKLLWEQFRETGFIETPLFSRKLFLNFFKDLNPAKLLNYFLQAFETERNMAVIHNVLQRTTAYESKLILYTYDSFLFDFHVKDGAEFIQIVKAELEQQGKFPTKLEIGPTYQNMVERNVN